MFFFENVETKIDLCFVIASLLAIQLLDFYCCRKEKEKNILCIFVFMMLH